MWLLLQSPKLLINHQLPARIHILLLTALQSAGAPGFVEFKSLSGIEYDSDLHYLCKLFASAGGIPYIFILL